MDISNADNFSLGDYTDNPMINEPSARQTETESRGVNTGNPGPIDQICDNMEKIIDYLA